MRAPRVRANACLLALLLLAPGASALNAARDAWELRPVDGLLQVREELELSPTQVGSGLAAGDEGAARVPFRLAMAARDVQVFADLGEGAAPVPWERTGPGVAAASLPRNATWTAARLLVLYALPSGPAGVRVEVGSLVAAERVEVTAALPEAWEARVDGASFAERRGGGVWVHAWDGDEPGAVGRARVISLAPLAGPSPLLVLGGLLALVLAGTMARALTANGGRPREPMRLLDHLRELQSRLRVVMLAVALLMVGLFTFALVPARVAGLELAVPVPSLTDNIAAQTFRLVAQQFVPAGVELVVVDPISGALVQVEVALFLALLVASPLVGYEAGTFLMPALLAHERKLLLRAIPVVTLLFVAGALFAYLLMVPTMMRVLYSYAAGLGARPFIAVDSLVSFAVVVTLVFGLAFELPVLMVLLAKLGLVSPRAMAARWRHVVVGLFVLAAVITPDPSVVSQVLVALPMLGLYLAGLVAARAAVRSASGAPSHGRGAA